MHQDDQKMYSKVRLKECNFRGHKGNDEDHVTNNDTPFEFKSNQERHLRARGANLSFPGLSYEQSTCSQIHEGGYDRDMTQETI